MEERMEYIVTQEEIDALKFMNSCDYNTGVLCPKDKRTTPCNKCGWNPRVSMRRLRKIRKELGL